MENFAVDVVGFHSTFTDSQKILICIYSYIIHLDAEWDISLGDASNNTAAGDRAEVLIFSKFDTICF